MLTACDTVNSRETDTQLRKKSNMSTTRQADKANTYKHETFSPQSLSAVSTETISSLSSDEVVLADTMIGEMLSPAPQGTGSVSERTDRRHERSPETLVVRSVWSGLERSVYALYFSVGQL